MEIHTFLIMELVLFQDISSETNTSIQDDEIEQERRHTKTNRPLSL